MGQREGSGQTQRVCSCQGQRQIQCDQRSINTQRLLSGSAENTSDTKENQSVDPTLPTSGESLSYLILD